ncbi:CLOCK-interacting pacemaker [Oryzias melastigma]|uniref:CLOCK-interacting pacemaker b n=1 Tax=Oryzias melastigma TaxID=30732 RepID=A0A3B3CHU9_ORYME|nr:CLOCK-interacting pacemaker [Oryzias melastigma]XP_024146921.1 CLOCK-interacting pacemaker [Oryzias melastigma]
MSTKRKALGHPRSADRVHTMKSRTSRPDSERDSGFSDASSEQMSSMETTDSEDSTHPVVRRGHRGSGLAVVGGSYSSLSPMIIMNNVLLKQPGENPPAMKPWGLNPTVKVVQPVVQQPPFVFIQPVVSRQASKGAPPRHKRSKKYLPILKSYPKIAPYPRDSSGRGSASSSISSSSGSERSSSSLNSNQWEASQRESTSDSPTPSLPVTAGAASPRNQSRPSLQSPEASTPSSAVTQTEVMTSPCSKNHPLSCLRPSSASSDQCSLSDCDSDSKRKRFCNTYNILSKSGLLDITLRTKELLRQNRRSQSELERLKEQTDLFLRALQSGDTGLRLQLQASLQEEEPANAARISLKAD